MSKAVSKNKETELYLSMIQPGICLKVLSYYRLSHSDLVKKEVTTKIKGKKVPNLKSEKVLMQVTPDQLSKLRGHAWFRKYLEQDKVIIFERPPKKNQIRSVKSFRPEIQDKVVNPEIQTKEVGMKRTDKIRWFVQPLNRDDKDVTNWRICDQFNIGQNPDRIVNDAEVVLDRGKKDKANLIELSQNQRNILIKADSENPEYKFNLFAQKGKGPIYLVHEPWEAEEPVFDDVNDGVLFDDV